MPSESKVSLDRIEVALWEWPGREPAIFLCHATGFHARVWDQIVQRLDGHHCYAPDMRGHGRSSKPAPPYAWRNFGEDIAAIADKLALRDAIGVGHSMGGHAIALAAALRPDTFSRLVLIDPVIRAREEYRGAWRESHFVSKRRNRWASAQEMFERFRDRPPFTAWDRTVLRDYCEYGVLPDGDGFVLACPPAIEASIYENSPMPASNIHDEIATIRIPVEVVRSTKEVDPADIMGRSPTTPGLAANFAQGKDLPIAEYSHFIPMEGPEFTAKLIAAASGGNALSQSSLL